MFQSIISLEQKAEHLFVYGDTLMTAIEKLHDFWLEWTIDAQIGSDSYSTVYRASQIIDGKPVYSAIKLITIPKSPADLDEIRAEGYDEQSAYDYFRKVAYDCIDQISSIADLRGASNIVSIEDYYVYEHSDEIRWDIFIRTEYLTCFSDFIIQNQLDEKAVCELGIDICRAVSLCQKRNIIHRDIRPDNIFISKDGGYKLGNFGIAGTLSRTAGTMLSIDTYEFMAPELIQQKNYDSTVDIYALGIVMYKLLNNNRIPFIDAQADRVNASDKKQAIENRLDGNNFPAPAYASTDMSIAILKACRFAPSQRYQSADEMRSALHIIQNSYEQPGDNKPPMAAVIASVAVCCISLFIIGFLIAPKIFYDEKITESTSSNISRQHEENAQTSESVPSQEITPKDPTPTYIPTVQPGNEDSVATDPSTSSDTAKADHPDTAAESVAATSVDNIVYIADVYESLTLRNAPSTSAAALCLLPPFTELYITEFTNDTMVKIITIGTGYTGYVNKNYLARKGAVTQRAGKSAPTTSSSDPVYYADVYDFLTLRNAPSTSAGEIDRLLPFTAMRVHSWNNGMAYVTVLETNQTGYVNGDYITTDPNSTKRAGKSPSTINMTSHGFSVGNYCYADVKEYLTLRNAPSTSAGELARLPDDTMMVILEICNEKMMKVQVVSTGQVGYVNRGFVK